MLMLFAFLASSCSQDQNRNTNNAKDSIAALDVSNTALNVASVDSLIVPGSSIGNMSLETDAATIYERLGKPDAGDAAMGKAVSTWYDDHDPTGSALSIYTVRDVGNSPTNMIKQIRVTAPGFKTMQGIGPSSTLSEIQGVFNLEKNRGYKNDQSNVAVYSDQSGISFEIDDRQKCVGIVVYTKGNFERDTYFRFLPGITEG